MQGWSDAGGLTRGSLRYFPVLAGRLEFAIEVRKALLRERPQVVAVELPEPLAEPYRRAVERLPEISVVLHPDADDEERMVYIPVEPADPFTEAVRTAAEIGADVVFIEPDLAERPHVADRAPDPYAVKFIGYEKFVELYRLHPAGKSDDVRAHAAGMAWRLQGADPTASTFVVLSLNMVDAVLEAMETPQEPVAAAVRRRGVMLANPHPECLAEILVEYPALQARYEDFRVHLSHPEIADRARTQLAVMRAAESGYRESTGEAITSWQRRLIARYTRNLAMIDQQLAAGVFDLAVAARAIVDDNYGWEVWEAANRYPSQRVESELETLRVSGADVWLNTRRIRLRRRLPNFKQRVRPSALKRRKKETRAGEWAEQLDGSSICSYPPEDMVIEEYGRFLKKKAKSILSEERDRTEPFRTSMLDGIDLRETIRNWHERQIYVRRQEKAAGDVGSVVVIFDEDREDRYTYLTTWLGENQNESDMAFYSTPPFEQMIGPGIGRAEYGGFLMTLPPRRMFDVWGDPDYEFAETKAERLLLAGIDYSVERLVAYVASKPPRSVFRTIAARVGRRILYIPIAQLSGTKLKKVRVVHVLDGHARRAEAGRYLW